MASEPRVYRLTPANEKSIYRSEHWANNLPDGRRVRLKVTTYFRRGTFEVRLTEAERTEILGKEHVVLDNHSCSCDKLQGEYSRTKDMVGGPWSVADSEQIKLLLVLPDRVYSGGPGESFMGDIELEHNGWLVDNTTYGVRGGCELEDISG